MELLKTWLNAIQVLPNWSLLVVPCCIPIVLLAVMLLKRKALYRPIVFFLDAVAFVLACGKCGVELAAFYLALLAVESVLFGFITCFTRRAKLSKQEAMYERFHEELVPKDSRPPKVTCFAQQEETYTDVEDSVRLSHVLSLLERLRREKLSAGDRLETDVLYRTLDGFRGKKLTTGELNTLNDCLATTLRLTAKYTL